MSGIMDARLARYKETMESTAIRCTQGYRRRDTRVAAKEAVVDVVSDCSEIEEDGRSCRSSAAGISAAESSVCPSRGRPTAVSGIDCTVFEGEGTDNEPDEARAGDYFVASPRKKALKVEEVLVGLRDALSEGINRLRWLIDFGYNRRSAKPKDKC